MKRLFSPRVIALLLSILVVVPSTLWVSADAKDDLSTAPLSSDVQAEQLPGALSRSATIPSASSDFCRQRLNNDERALYDAIDTAVIEFASSAGFLSDNYSDTTVITAIANVALTPVSVTLVFTVYLADHPQYFWISNQFAHSITATRTTLILYIEPDYRQATTRCETLEKIAETEARWLAILNRYPSDYDKARVLHDLICREIDYAYTDDGHTPESSKWAHSIVGVMTGRGAVCDGYAKTFHYMLTLCGIDAATILGNSYSVSDGTRTNLGAHAWNAVKLDGEYYLVDVTWDDIGTRDGFDPARVGYSNYDYFCTQSSVFAESHEPYTAADGNYVNLESGVFSDSTAYEYYRVYGGYLDDLSSVGGSLEEFTKNAIAKRVDELIYIASKSTDNFNNILHYAGVNGSVIFTSQTYGYVMVIFRERVRVDAPERPEFITAAPNSVVLSTSPGLEFSSDGLRWQTSGEFTGLTPGQQLTLYCRKARTVDAYESEPSAPLYITVPSTELSALEVDLAAPELVSDINLNLFVRSGLASSYDSIRLVIEMCGNTCELDGETNASTVTIGEHSYHKFRYTGIAAKQMSETLTIRLIGTLNGADYPGTASKFSIRDYCMYQLDNSDDNELRTLCADLLYYGTAAQKFFNYRIDDLADAKMTAEHRQLATSSVPSLISKLELSNAPENAEVSFFSALLSLDGAVSVVCMFDAEAADELISFEVWLDADGDGERGAGEVQTITTSYGQYTLGGRTYRTVNIGAIPARLMRSDIYVTAYVDGQVSSACLHYSVETYAAAMTEDASSESLAELCRALIRYSDSACRYAIK